jgi:hypothetical protein
MMTMAYPVKDEHLLDNLSPYRDRELGTLTR